MTNPKIRLNADDGSALYRGHVEIPDPDLLAPSNLDAINKKYSDRNKVTVSDTAPINEELYVGKLWYDTTDGINALKMWDGTQWVLVAEPGFPLGDGANGLTLYVNNTTGSDVYVTGTFDQQASPPISQQMRVAGYSEQQPFKTIARAAIEVARITTGLSGFDPRFYDRIVIKVSPGDQITANEPPSLSETQAAATAITATYNAATGALSCTIANPVRDLTTDDFVLFQQGSLTFSCTSGGQTGTLSSPEPGDPAFQQKLKILTVAKGASNTVFTCNVGNAGTAASSPHTFVSSLANGIALIYTPVITPWADGYVPDADELRKFNHSDGGVMLPRGCSVIGTDLRKSIIRPTYVPDIAASLDDNRAAIFRMTGGAYFFQFTFKDALNASSTHHLLDCFSYTSDQELEDFYNKVRTALSISLPASVANPGETQIVAPQPTTPFEGVDGIIGSSPYIFNCSIRSVWGLCGIFADGATTTGFKSIVVAQFTGVSLQRDMRCWQFYNETGATPVWTDFTVADPYDSLIATQPNDFRMNPERVSSHIRTKNGAVIQEVSVFAIGQGIHHWAESGSEITITNSNSNFGGCAAIADGYKDEAFPTDTNWEVNRLRVGIGMTQQTNNIRTIFLGKIVQNQNDGSTTIELEQPLAPGIYDVNTPRILEQDGYSLDEDNYIWIQNFRGLDYRALLTADAWDAANPKQIRVKSNFETQTGQVPGDVLIPDPNNPILYPGLGGSRIYIRRLQDTRISSERQYSILGFTTAATSRTPLRDYVLQTVPGTQGVVGLLPPEALSTVSEAGRIVDEAGSDIQVELRWNGGDTAWTAGELYRLGETVQYLNKHWNCVLENSDLTFQPSKWKESYVHMPSDFDQEGFYKNAKPQIIWNADTSGLEESLDLGYNYSDPNAANYVWTDDPVIYKQLRTATDYRGLQNFLLGIGFTEDQSNQILLPRTRETRDLNPRTPIDNIPNPSGAANDWANWGIEFRRPTSIRLFGHAYEWAGFWNYTKAIPKYQKELSPANAFTFYFTNVKGGRVYASGFNEEGFVVTPKGLIDLATGEEIQVDQIGFEPPLDEGINFPTFYEFLEVNNLTVNTTLALTTSVISGAPNWDDGGDAYVKTQEKLGPFGGVLPFLPKSTTEQEGIIELATVDEVRQGLDDEKAVTPATLAAAGVPAGSVLFIASATVPFGFLEANGDAIPNGNGTVQGITRDFSALFAALGGTYGTNGGNNLLPDMRGEFARGWKGSRAGADPDRTTQGQAQAGAFASHSHSISDALTGQNAVAHPVAAGPTAGGSGVSRATASQNAIALGHSHSAANSGGTETRPTNVALLAIIKY